MIEQYNRKYLMQIWEDRETFVADFQDSGLDEDNLISEESLKKLFLLLYARYGNNPIANQDENQFKYKVYSIVYQYGPTWQRKIEIQKTLRGLSETDLLTGQKTINNHAFNPSTAPSTSTLDELPKIDAQTTSINKRSKLDAYNTLWNILETNVTANFLDKFKDLFMKVVAPQHPLLYESEED